MINRDAEEEDDYFEQLEQIVNWDVETYRNKLEKSMVYFYFCLLDFAEEYIVHRIIPPPW